MIQLVHLFYSCIDSFPPSIACCQNRLANVMQPGIIKRVQESKMAFKCMENINSFLEAAKTFGVPSQELFQTVDLWERQNLNAVVICLQALGRKVQKKKISKILFAKNGYNIKCISFVICHAGFQVRSAVDWTQRGREECPPVLWLVYPLLLCFFFLLLFPLFFFRGATESRRHGHLPAVWLQ